MFADAIWSHYSYVKNRIIAKNNGVDNVAGVFNAQDWPSKPIKFNFFYLLELGDAPIGSQGYSQYAPMIFHQLQWVWVIKGTDISAGVRVPNRGDRFSISQTMKGLLLYGLAPGYTEKLTWAMNNATGKMIGSSLSPVEAITWPPVDFHERYDKDTGLVYGSGALRIFDMTEAITS